MFTHNPVEIRNEKLECRSETILYDSNGCTSITTVLNVQSNEGLIEWRNRVGHDVANYIARTVSQLVELKFTKCVRIF